MPLVDPGAAKTVSKPPEGAFYLRESVSLQVKWLKPRRLPGRTPTPSRRPAHFILSSAGMGPKRYNRETFTVPTARAHQPVEIGWWLATMKLNSAPRVPAH